MNEELRIGPHVVRYEPPDIVFMKFVGDISGPDVREVVTTIRSRTRGYDYLLLLIDLSDTGSVLPEARSASRARLEDGLRIGAPARRTVQGTTRAAREQRAGQHRDRHDAKLAPQKHAPILRNMRAHSPPASFVAESARSCANCA
jgi:hypothetical protein